jgi:hypothetical protein
MASNHTDIAPEPSSSLEDSAGQDKDSLDDLRNIYNAFKNEKTKELYYYGSPHSIAIISLQTLLNELGYGAELRWEGYGTARKKAKGYHHKRDLDKREKEKLRTHEWAFYFWLSGQDSLIQTMEIQHALSRLDTFYKSDQYRVNG